MKFLKRKHKTISRTAFSDFGPNHGRIKAECSCGEIRWDSDDRFGYASIQIWEKSHRKKKR